MSPRTGSVIAPSARRTLLKGPLGALLLLSATETENRLAVVEHSLAPRALGAPVHTHRHEDEYSIVLEGTVGVQIGEQVFEAGSGSVVVKPRGVPHAFWNPTDQPARLLEILSPAGFESYFAELGEILAASGLPDMAALGALAERYGLELDPASIPRLAAAHGLDLGGSSLASSTPDEWDAAYAGVPPWDTGRAQPAFIRLAEAGRLAGRLLDVGCGTGENTLLAAAHGSDALGIDIAARAVARAQAKAAERGLPAQFAVADALDLGALGELFDVVIDSGTFHVFDDVQRAAYIASLAAVTRPGAVCYLLCFSDQTPGQWGPRRVSQEELGLAFSGDWTIETIAPAAFELAAGNPIAQANAWLATIRRR